MSLCPRSPARLRAALTLTTLSISSSINTHIFENPQGPVQNIDSLKYGRVVFRVFRGFLTVSLHVLDCKEAYFICLVLYYCFHRPFELLWLDDNKVVLLLFREGGLTIVGL